MPTPIDRIFYRRLTDADLFNIEKGQAAVQGQGGASQTYIDIPASVVPALFEMLHATTPPEARMPVSVEAQVIGSPGDKGILEFAPRYKKADGDGRYRITKQNRQFAGGARHPAWTAARGFPRTWNGWARTPPTAIGPPRTRCSRSACRRGSLPCAARTSCGRISAGALRPGHGPSWRRTSGMSSGSSSSPLRGRAARVLDKCGAAA